MDAITNSFTLAMAQLNPTVGALDANAERIGAAYARAKADGADLLLTPELSLIGYPPEDLVLKPAFQRAVAAKLDELAKLTHGGPGLVVGAISVDAGGALRNALVIMADGGILTERYKHDLPNYGVFDEQRVFAAHPPQGPVNFRGLKLGLMICEDMWFSDVTETLSESGAEILLVPTCSPFELGKGNERLAQAAARVMESELPLVFCNQVGGQDELVFDGASFVLDAAAGLAGQLRWWQEDYALVSFGRASNGWMPHDIDCANEPDREEILYRALMTGLADYVEKNHFPGVVLGLSGGIDSALSAAVAVDALGADRVHCVMMPSRYTSDESLEDAEACAKALGVRYDTISIAPGVQATDDMLSDIFERQAPDLTEENLQSRLRGLTLMAISNKFGPMVLTTGNKSEMAVGYATLYGDMCGGYSVLKDVYKLDVFSLSRWRNRTRPDGAYGPAGEVIPERIITKPPSAELREDQKDEDSLPPYEILDEILKGLVDGERSSAELIEAGFDAETVARIQHLVYVAEYKRRQSPPGVKVTSKNFGRDRRYPITNGFRDR